MKEQCPEAITAPFVESLNFFEVFYPSIIQEFQKHTQFQFAMTKESEIYVLQSHEIDISNNTTHIFGSERHLITICPALTSTEIRCMGVPVSGDPTQDIDKLTMYYNSFSINAKRKIVAKMIRDLKALKNKGLKQRGRVYNVNGGNNEPEAN